MISSRFVSISSLVLLSFLRFQTVSTSLPAPPSTHDPTDISGRLIGNAVISAQTVNASFTVSDENVNNNETVLGALFGDLDDGNVQISNRSSAASSSVMTAADEIMNNDFEVASLKQSSSDLKSLYGTGTALLPPIYAPVYHPPPHFEKYPTYVPTVYTRAKLGYGSSYYNGREAELRCQFPFNLRLNSVSNNHLSTEILLQSKYTHMEPMPTLLLEEVEFWLFGNPAKKLHSILT